MAPPEYWNDMPKGQLKINGVDAFTTYGMSISDGGVSALLTPAANKGYITNKSRLEHGTRYINNNPKVEERSVSVPFHITAKTKEQFFTRYDALCTVFAAGNLTIWTSFAPSKYFHMVYDGCTQFGEYQQQMAKFVLKLIEPDPTNRSV